MVRVDWAVGIKERACHSGMRKWVHLRKPKERYVIFERDVIVAGMLKLLGDGDLTRTRYVCG